MCIRDRLKGIFNIGAGVDALLKLKLPPQAVVVRLEDAGMAVQMAEYVCQAVIRHFREFDVYALSLIHISTNLPRLAPQRAWCSLVRPLRP